MKDSNNNEETKMNYENMSPDDIQALELLKVQKIAQIMFIYSDILAYESTLEGIELIYSKYNGKQEHFFNPDATAVQSLNWAIFAKVISTGIGFTRYEHLYEKAIKGEIDYSLTPNININFGNAIGLVSYFYLLYGAIGIYERDLSQPVFGI